MAVFLIIDHRDDLWKMFGFPSTATEPSMAINQWNVAVLAMAIVALVMVIFSLEDVHAVHRLVRDVGSLLGWLDSSR